MEKELGLLNQALLTNEIAIGLENHQQQMPEKATGHERTLSWVQQTRDYNHIVVALTAMALDLGDTTTLCICLLRVSWKERDRLLAMHL